MLLYNINRENTQLAPCGIWQIISNDQAKWIVSDLIIIDYEKTYHLYPGLAWLLEDSWGQ